MLFSLFTVPAQAVSAITIGTTTFGAGVATNVGVNLSGFDESQNYQVTVKFVNTTTNVDVTNGTLAATHSGTSLVPTYTSYSAAKLGFTGTYSQISSALSTLTWNPSSASGDISIRIGIATKPAENDFYDANSGHYYRYVSTGTTWALAKSAAANTTLFGLYGYLAHITSKAENDFIANEITAPNIWMGATDQAVEGQWKFDGADIPGENDVFNIWAGANNLTSSKTGYGRNDWYSGRVAGWNALEPNNGAGGAAQNCGVTNYININNWDDLACSNTQGYLIEFGGRSGETSTAATRTLTTTVVAREAVTLGTLNSNVSCTFGVDCSFPLSLTNPTAKNSSNVDVVGTFAYTSSNTASTTVSGVTGGASVALVNAGTSTITATFTPTNTALYASNTKTFNITVTATAPAAPTGLAATAGNTQATLSWTAASNGGSNITDYLVQYSTDNSTWTTFADGTSTSTSATVTGLTNGTLYYFRVSAINAVNTSAASSTASTTPVVPSSGGGGSTPTATPTPTPTPSVTTTARPRPTQSANPIIQNPLNIPTEPKPGRSNSPEPLLRKLIEDVANSLKPIIINIFTQPSQGPNPSFDAKRALEVATPTPDKKVVELPSYVRIDNELQSSKLVVIDNTTVQVVTEFGGLLSVEAKDGVTTIPVDNTGKVQMIRSNTVNTEGIGLQPNSEFAVYLFSEPTLLGVGKSDATGKFFASFTVDKNFPLGNHTLQINGTLSNGKASSISMPVTVIENADIARSQAMPKTIFVDENPVARATDALYLIIAIFAFLILFMLFGGSRLFLAAVRRRKDED